MESLIIIVLILAIVQFVVQLGLIKKRSVSFFLLLLFSVFIYFVHPHAIEQSYSKYQILISNNTWVANLMVLQIIEAVGGILLSIYLIQLEYNEPVKPLFRYLKYIPGPMVFVAVFYFESIFYLTFPVLDFNKMAFILTLAIPILFFISKYLIKKLVKEYDLRLELKFLLHLIQFFVAVVVSIKLFELPVRSIPVDNLHIQFITLLLVLIVCAMLGMFFHNRNIKKNQQKVLRNLE